jgi:hypothetical protein
MTPAHDVLMATRTQAPGVRPATRHRVSVCTGSHLDGLNHDVDQCAARELGVCVQRCIAGECSLMVSSSLLQLGTQACMDTTMMAALRAKLRETTIV